MPAEVPQSTTPDAMTLAHVLRAIIKALLLFVAFNLAYREWQPVQTNKLPTLYNTVVEGRARLAWEVQSNVPMLIRDHEIWTASADTWNVAMFGSSETFGWPPDYRVSAPHILTDWALETQAGQRVHFYNLSVPSGDLWKDLMIAQQVLDSGLPVDLLVFNVFSYALETGYPHDIIIRNPTLARTIIDQYGVDPSWNGYLSEAGVQTVWTERETLGFWVNNQVEALNWQGAHSDNLEPEMSVTPLAHDMGVNKNLPITRADFLQVIRKMAEDYHVDVLLINAPRPYAEDEFSDWIQSHASSEHVALLNCEFVYEPRAFFDHIHLMPESYPEYARLLIKSLTNSEMSSVSSQLPLRVPSDFTPPNEACVFQPAS